MTSIEKLVIDTDTGIDDALALFLAFSSKTLVLVIAITCCFGNTKLENVCQNVMRVLNLINKTEVPIYKGSAGPLIESKRKPAVLVMGEDGLGNAADEFPTGNLRIHDTPAAMALVQLTLKYPGEINLLAIGPLTNVAIAQRLDPDFTCRLKSLTIMGGNYKGIGNVNEVAEFNFYADPDAAEIVVSDVKCPVTLIPWETTYEYGPDWHTYEKLTEIQTRKGRFFKRTSKYLADRGRKKGNKNFCDCDLLAVIAFLYPHSVKAVIESSLAVEVGGQYSAGQTILLRDSNPNANDRTRVKIITAFDLDFLNKLRFELLQQD